MYVLWQVFLVPVVVRVGDVHLVVEGGYLLDALFLYGVGDLQDNLAWVQLAEFLDNAAERFRLRRRGRRGPYTAFRNLKILGFLIRKPIPVVIFLFRKVLVPPNLPFRRSGREQCIRVSILI